MRLITRGDDERQDLPERRWRHALGRASLTVTAVFLLVIGAPFGATAGGAKHPFDAMAVHRPAEPFAAPELILTSLDGGEVRLSALRGKVIVLGFFTTT